jgi:predicted dehydrogenase
MNHFVRVIRREEEPLVSVDAALGTLAATRAVTLSTERGTAVSLDELLG